MMLRERMRLGRRGVIGVVVALAVVVAAGGWLVTRQDASAAPQTITSTIASGTVQDSVSATGTLEPLHEADLSFAVGGTVTTVPVAAGDVVHKGQVLATLDRTSLEASVTSAQAQLTAAQAQYDDDSDADASSTQLASDNASVASAESQLSQAQDNLDSGVLRATMRGTVASVALEVGDSVSGTSSSGSASSSGSSSSQGQSSGGQSAASGQGSTSTTASTTSTTSQVVVVSPKLFTVSAAVSADDVASVKKGMQATITPSGGAAVYGTVTTVGLVAETSSSGSATFPVTVTLTGPQKNLYAGTTATVAIITKQQTGVLTVPTAALHTSGSTTYVTKVSGSKNVRQTVTLGATYGATTVVTSGLKSGDKVVVITLRTPTGGGTTRTGNRGGFGGGTGGFGGGTGGFPSGGGIPPGGPGGAP